jgi:hypothetical protein
MAKILCVLYADPADCVSRSYDHVGQRLWISPVLTTLIILLS